jgi:deoxyribodipyrimidine photolyase
MTKHTEKHDKKADADKELKEVKESNAAIAETGHDPKAEAKAHKEAEKEVKKLFAHVKPKDLELEGELQVGVVDPRDKTRALASSTVWPAWVTQALAMLRTALSKIGIDLTTIEHAGEVALQELIDMVQASKPSWQRLIVLAALAWMQQHLPADQVTMALKGA